MYKEPERLFVEFLRRRGFNVTAARRKIVRKIFSLHGHFGVTDLWEALRDERISIATVYRTLDLLEQAGVVRRVSLGESRARYELVLGRAEHGHLVCRSCGRVIEFDAGRMKELLEEIASQNDFELQEMVIQGYGLCRDCRRQPA